ncbi:MAG TPA: pre-peptidase C-terminal domain-containing protein [Dyella sp.]|nr:pre-peptidase C-terminal domain-containing protein [Dyella sp.]
MELQQYGAGRVFTDRWVKLSPGRSGPSLTNGLFWLLSSILLSVGVANAQSTQYTYDANGRVVAIMANNGSSVQYSYDSLGHASQVGAPLSSGQLAIFAFVPTHGATGAEVTLDGQGFSSSLANDNVSFNGAAATVLSASATQMVVSVPNGATTGPIGVTVSGQTATSATLFVVDDAEAPPTITQVSPLVVAAGGTVTVTGTHLDPVASGTTVQMGGVDMLTGLSPTNTQVQYTVPSNAMSGHVTVNTPYGSATSAVPVAVLPSNIVSEASNAPTSFLVANGSAVGFNTGAAGQIGILTFDAPQGGNYELTFNGITITGSSATEMVVNVYAPNGSLVLTYNCYTSNPGASCRLPLWGLTPGTYTAVVLPPNTSSIVAFNAIVEQDTIGPAVVANTPTTVNLAAGEVERLTFNASAGSTIALQLSGVSTTPTGQPIYVQVYAPGTVPSNNPSNYYTIFNTSTAATVNLQNLPASGTYTVIVSTYYGVPGNAQLTFVQSVTTTVSDNGAEQKEQATLNGQNIYLSFDASQGDNLELTFNGIAISGSSSTSINVNVYGPTGAQVMSYSCYTTNPGASCRLPLWNLTATGTYSVVVTPPTSSSLISFNVILEPDTIGPALTTGMPTSVNLAAGEVERFTFSANAGSTIALQLLGVGTTPAGQAMYVQVYAPGTVPSATNYYTIFNTSGSTTANLQNLPASGTYIAVVSLVPGTPGSAQLTLASGAGGTITESSGAQRYQGNAQGENVYLTFSANQGDNLELTLSDLAIAGSSATSATVNVYGPSGAYITSTTCYTTSPGAGCRLSLWNLATGTYSAVIAPPNASSVISFNAALQSDLVEPTLADNTPTAFSLSPDTVERLSFNANQGDNVELTFSGITITGSSNTQMSVNVLNSAGTSVLTYQCYTTTPGASCRLPLWNLAAGTYTAVVYSVDTVSTVGFTTVVQTDVMGPALMANAPTTVNLATGEVERFTFNATAGQTVALQLSGVATTPTAQPIYVQVYAAGTVPSNSPGNYYAIFNTATTETVNFPNLPTSGTYTVVASTFYGIPGNAQLTLESQ